MPLTLAESGNIPGLENVLDVVAQRAVHALTDAAAQQERDGQHDNSKDRLNHHQRVAPPLADTAPERAAHDVDRLVAAQYHGRHETSQRAHEDDARHEGSNSAKARILQ